MINELLMYFAISQLNACTASAAALSAIINSLSAAALLGLHANRNDYKADSTSIRCAENTECSNTSYMMSQNLKTF